MTPDKRAAQQKLNGQLISLGFTQSEINYSLTTVAVNALRAQVHSSSRAEVTCLAAFLSGVSIAWQRKGKPNRIEPEAWLSIAQQLFELLDMDDDVDMDEQRAMELVNGLIDEFTGKKH